MKTTRLGDTGLEVSKLGLSTLEWGHRLDEFTALDLLQSFLGSGGNFVDIGSVGTDALPAQITGRAIAKTGAREQIVLSATTGVGGTSARAILNDLEQTLREASVEHIDLWQVSYWDSSVPIDETLAAMHDAVRRGLVRYVGFGYSTGWQTALAAERYTQMGPGAHAASVRMEYSLLRRSAEREVMPAAEHLGLGLIACAPLARGVLTGKYRDGLPADSRVADESWEPILAGYLDSRSRRIVEAVARAAEGLRVPAAHVALSWLHDMPGVSTVLVGARSVIQLEASLSSESLMLPPEIHDALTDVSEGAR